MVKKFYKHFVNIDLNWVLLRAHNLNFEGYWWDEMLGFWTANLNISFLETYNRHISADYTIGYHLL